jgi:hypothetical protein
MPQISLLIKFFLLFGFYCYSVVASGQHKHPECKVKINNNERKIFKKLPPVKDTSISGITSIKDVTIQYLGAGGILISKGETVVAIDPFFSNGAMSYTDWLKPWKTNLLLKPDTAALNKVVVIKNLKNVNAVFITHAHYDHLLDVPYLYQKIFLKHPTVYGNNSVNSLLKNLIPAGSLINVQDSAVQYSKPQLHWISVGPNVRVMPILSDHAPHYKFVKFFDGETIDSPTMDEYYKGTDPVIWKEGRTLAYVVEITGPADTLRIHIQTSACTPDDGLPPASYMKQIGRVDISMFCMASFDNVSNYPDRLIHYLNPKKIIIVHWENFFRKYNMEKKHYKVVPFTNGLCFLERMDKILFPATVREKCLLPVPNSFITVH